MSAQPLSKDIDWSAPATKGDIELVRSDVALVRSEIKLVEANLDVRIERAENGLKLAMVKQGQ